MKIISGLIFSFIFSGILVCGMPNIIISNDVLSTFYTVSGIMFSIGMSLTIISNTTGVRNHSIRLRIRKNIKKVRDYFIWCFSIVSIIFVIRTIIIGIEIGRNPISAIVKSYISWLTLLYILYSIYYFIFNFIAIQHLNEEIEEAIYKAK